MAHRPPCPCAQNGALGYCPAKTSQCSPARRTTSALHTPGTSACQRKWPWTCSVQPPGTTWPKAQPGNCVVGSLAPFATRQDLLRDRTIHNVLPKLEMLLVRSGSVSVLFVSKLLLLCTGTPHSKAVLLDLRQFRAAMLWRGSASWLTLPRVVCLGHAFRRMLRL